MCPKDTSSLVHAMLARQRQGNWFVSYILFYFARRYFSCTAGTSKQLFTCFSKYLNCQLTCTVGLQTRNVHAKRVCFIFQLKLSAHVMMVKQAVVIQLRLYEKCSLHVSEKCKIMSVSKIMLIKCLLLVFPGRDSTLLRLSCSFEQTFYLYLSSQLFFILLGEDTCICSKGMVLQFLIGGAKLR